MELTAAQEHYIFTTKIELDDGDYVVLKEPTSFMLREFNEDGKQNIEILQKIFPKCLIEHSFTDAGQPAKNEKVSALLLDSGTTFTKIINIWMNALPLDQKKSGKLDK